MALNGFTYNVTWADFIKVPTRPQGVTEDAQIHPEIVPGNFVLGKKGRAMIIKDVDIDISLVAQDCWVLSTQTTNSDLLSHEQGHYDIIALCAREMLKGFLALTAPSVHELQTRATSLQEKFQRKVATIDARYDVKTNHSRNQSVQHTWDQKIAAEKQKPDGSIDNLPT